LPPERAAFAGGLSLSEQVDLLIVGGGINGAGIARDAAGRGLSVVLVEQDDLASHTSRWSSKLIHGGLRYLEHHEFRLVREALIEREVLLRAAPHIVWPLTFVLPHSPEQRPAWMIRLGLFLYDHLGGRELLPASTSVRLAGQGAYGDPLQPWVKRGFTYADCWVEDSRLVVLNAMAAAERGAVIRTRSRCERARRDDGGWLAEIVGEDDRRAPVRARALVNAAGPWVSSFLSDGLGVSSAKRVRLIKGSHIVVPRLYPGEHPYILQNDDQRIVFVIPFEGAFSLIGTTDVPYEGDPAGAAITPDETDYLCRVINRYFRHQIGPSDVVWSYAGVRPLYDDASGDASAVTRDYVFDLDAGDGRAPLLSIFGGKITTYRKLAEHALAKLQPVMGFSRGAWTAGTTLPGGDIPKADFSAFLAAARREHPWLPEQLLYRWARAYGTHLAQVVGGASRVQDLGQDLGGGLFEAEIDYLVAHEWAQTADDILWRRSRLGLHVGQDTVGRLIALLETGRVHARAAEFAR
jgi:glycerol-3-phosphate dehydrogenase